MAETMKAWRYSSPGKLDTTLHLDTAVTKPTEQDIGNEEVLVEVIASGLNPADYKVQELGLVVRAVFSFPNTAGMDVCGKVSAAGKNVTGLRPGDLVTGRVRPFSQQGSLSETAIVESANLAVVSPSCDLHQAAGLPTVGLTAYQAIVPYVEPGRGDRVFINGGSGGLGTMSIQIAKILGCHVTVSCSTPKMDLCRELGADKIIDYKTTNVVQALRDEGRPYHLIVDNVGNDPADLFSSSNDYLSRGCPYIFVGGNVSFASVKNLILARTLPIFLGGARGAFHLLITKDVREDLAALCKWVEEGKLRVIIDKVFSFDDSKVAMQYLKKGSNRGKVIVEMGDATRES